MERLCALVRFLPDLEKPGFLAGSWVKPEPGSDGVLVFPYAQYSDVVTAFVEAAYENGWVQAGFDWSEWAGTEEARQLRDEESALASATADQLGRLMTVCIRQDRFVEGALLEAFDSGLMLRIVRRAEVLLKDVQAD